MKHKTILNGATKTTWACTHACRTKQASRAPERQHARAAKRRNDQGERQRTGSAKRQSDPRPSDPRQSSPLKRPSTVPVERLSNREGRGGREPGAPSARGSAPKSEQKIEQTLKQGSRGVNEQAKKPTTHSIDQSM